MKAYEELKLFGWTLVSMDLHELIGLQKSNILIITQGQTTTTKCFYH
jgi:hypothetical protein